MTALAYSQSYPLRDGFAVEFSLDNGRLEARWKPRLPHGRKARRLLPAYRAARNSFLASLGVNVAVVEL